MNVLEVITKNPYSTYDEISEQIQVHNPQDISTEIMQLIREGKIKIINRRYIALEPAVV